MGTFFVSWDLWQEMTFVLGCCIVIVFGLGLAKLWWTNRAMRKLEKLDAEKRARRSDVSYCGIDAWKIEEIPFGVRAIQRGVEVDGIWISRPEHDDSSQVASSATLVGQTWSYTKEKEKALYRALKHERREHRLSESASCSTDGTIQAEYLVAPPQMPATTSRRRLSQTNSDSSGPQATVDATPSSHLQARELHNSQPFSQSEHGHQAATATATRRTMADVHSHGDIREGNLQDTTVYGAAKVHANRDMRRPNQGFEILPAGALGPRQELEDSDGKKQGSHDERRDRQHEVNPQARRAKLRKKPPMSSLK